MKSFFLSLFALVLVSGSAQQGFNCISHDVFQREMSQNPAFAKQQQQLETETQQFLSAKSQASSATYIIPVVFHVIYTTNAGNISQAQIVNQIQILNSEFKRLQPDTALTPGPFKSLAAPFDVEFRLATIDPNGNCTNGINRVYSSLANCSFGQDDVKALSYWPSNKYLNIWIVQSMHYSGSMSCNGGGYATFPGGPANLDGINIRGDLISNIGTAATNSSWGNFKGRYLIHELGHWFNLRHIWGDAPCGNDLVSDTPTHMTDNSGCPNFPHNPFSSCAGSNGNGEMYTDYMDYTNGPCLNMFTAGQVARMTACINSNVSGRSNLWSAANLNATGTADPYTYPAPCVAQPEFLASGPVLICAGDSVKFTDNSYGGNASSRNWTFNGGSPSSSSDSIVYARYDVPGVYAVSLSKTFQSTTKTKTHAKQVYVIDPQVNPNYYMPMSDSFEDQNLFNADWTIIDRDNDGHTWQFMSTTYYTGSYCVGVINYDKPAPLSEELISPAYDMSQIISGQLRFRLHSSVPASSAYDKLTIFISNNCGKTWNMIYNKTSSIGLTTYTNTTPFSYIPTPASDEWRLETVLIPNVWASGVVRFKFVFTSGGGNNLFLDDIEVDGTTTVGLTEGSRFAGLNIYPNPARESLTFELSSTADEFAEIAVYDLLGKRLIYIHESGSRKTLNIAGLPPGVYVARVQTTSGDFRNVKITKQENEP